MGDTWSFPLASGNVVGKGSGLVTGEGNRLRPKLSKYPGAGSVRPQWLTLWHFLTSWTPFLASSHLSPAPCAPFVSCAWLPLVCISVVSGVTLLHWALTAPGVLGVVLAVGLLQLGTLLQLQLLLQKKLHFITSAGMTVHSEDFHTWGPVLIWGACDVYSCRNFTLTAFLFHDSTCPLLFLTPVPSTWF